MAALPTSAQLLAQMRLWYDALVFVDATPKRDDAGDVRLSWMFTNDRHLPTTQLLEAAELFVLLALADADAWRVAVVEMLAMMADRDRVPWVREVLLPSGAATTTALDVLCSSLVVANELCAFLLADMAANDAHSDEYERFKPMLRRRLGPDTSRVRLRVTVGRCMPKRATLWPFAAQFAQLVQRQGTDTPDALAENGVSRRNRMSTFGLIFDGLHISHLGPAKADTSLLDNFSAIVHSGVRLNHLPRLDVVPTQANAQLLATALQALLSVKTAGGQRAVGVRGVDVATVDQGETMQALCSAVAASTSVREVNVYVPALYLKDTTDQVALERLRRQLHWLAFAVFSGRANSRPLVNVTIDGVAKLNGASDVMREVLAINDPLAGLFGPSVASHRQLRVEGSRFALFDPTVSEQTDSVMLEARRHTGLRVLSRNKGWLSVLLPGWGQAWIKDQDADLSSVEAETNDKQLLVPHIRPISHLTLHSVRDQDKRGVLDFLELVGQGVAKLDIGGYYDTPVPLESWCPSILTSCANLEELVLWIMAPSKLSELAACLKAHSCRLKKLSLSVDLLTHSAVNDVVLLLDTLAETRFPLVFHLESFHFTAWSMENRQQAIHMSALHAAHRVLQKNKRLLEFTLQLPLAVDSMDDVPALKASVDLHQNAQLPFYPCGKLAVLSVASHTDSKLARVVQQLDSAVLAMIFQFAAPHQRRRVNVPMPELAQDH